MENFWVQMITAIIGSVLASSGLWALIMRRMDSKDAKTELLIGMAHDRIMFLGMSYLDRGYITRNEYENLHEYLYNPYKKLAEMDLPRILSSWLISCPLVRTKTRSLQISNDS